MMGKRSSGGVVTRNNCSVAGAEFIEDFGTLSKYVRVWQSGDDRRAERWVMNKFKLNVFIWFEVWWFGIMDLLAKKKKIRWRKLLE